MYMMSVNHGTQASRRLGFFVGSVAGDAVADERLSVLGDGKVGVGTTAPEANLHVYNGSAGSFTASNSQLLIENNTTVRLTMVSPAGNGCAIEFGDVNDQDVGAINYDHTSNQFRITAGAQPNMAVIGYQEAVFNENSYDADFRVESNTDANALFVDGGNNRVIVGSNTGNAPFAVKRNSPADGRLASFGSISVAGSAVCAGTGGAVSIARSVITVEPSTVTELVSGYGGSYIMMVINSPSGVDDVQRTVVATHGWSSVSILFDNNYGSNVATFTFSVASGVLRISHNHSGALRFGVSCLIVPAPTTGS
tara:strand:- start:304 stop:1230 length:927 start_codon:yes stop_codon:yes gene_type:complete